MSCSGRCCCGGGSVQQDVWMNKGNHMIIVGRLAGWISDRVQMNRMLQHGGSIQYSDQSRRRARCYRNCVGNRSDDDDGRLFGPCVSGWNISIRSVRTMAAVTRKFVAMGEGGVEFRIMERMTTEIVCRHGEVNCFPLLLLHTLPLK